MDRTLHRRETSQTTAVTAGLAIMCAMACHGLSQSQPVFADEDDVIVEQPRNDGEVVKLIEGEVILLRVANVRERQIYLMLFGDLYQKSRRDIDVRMDQQISAIAANYRLTTAEYDSIVLASRADRVRLDREIAELRASYEASSKTPQELNDLLIKVQLIFREASSPPNASSFFAKKISKVLAGKTRIPNLGVHDVFSTDLLRNRHKADVEAAVRAVGRSVNLRHEQRQALIDVLLRETQPAKVFGDFDDVVIKYRLSQLPEEKLKPLFGEDQWPQVLLALDGFREFGPFLKRHGLAATGPVPDKRAAPQVAGPPTPARPPVKSGEE